MFYYILTILSQLSMSSFQITKHGQIFNVYKSAVEIKWISLFKWYTDRNIWIFLIVFCIVPQVILRFIVVRWTFLERQIKSQKML